MDQAIQDAIEGAGGGGCFRAGTKVQLEGGKSIAIELLKEGDEILAFDEAGKLHVAKVKKVHYHENPEPILRVRFWRGEVFITPNHWVLNQYNSFVEMSTLTTHDALVDGMGHLRPILDMELVGHEPVWNLTVEPHATFIANGVRVHNGGHRARYPEIEGAGGGGGGGKGGGGSARAAIEADDSLQSKSSVGIIDLLGEGEIGGLVNGARSIYLNETPLQNPDGSYNFSDVIWEQRTGTQYQGAIGSGSAFDAVSAPVAVGVQLKKGRPQSISILNPEASQAMVIVATPSLMSQDKTTGDINGTSVEYIIEVSSDGGPFQAQETRREWWDAGSWGWEEGHLTAYCAGGAYGLGASISITADGDMTVRPDYWANGAWHQLGGILSLNQRTEHDENGNVVATTGVRSAYVEAPTGASKIRFVVLTAEPPWRYSGSNIMGQLLNAIYQPPAPSITTGGVRSWVGIFTHTISGKTRSRYQRSHIVQLPPGNLRIVRVTRLTDDSTTASVNNDIYLDSVVERMVSRLNYPNSALVAVTVNAAQFTSIPRRAYLVDGLYIRVPSNYNVTTRTYSGIWNGSFKLAVSNNPAWVLYDILTNKRYGLGDYINESQVDKAALYQIGRYCDELVPDGQGRYEPRFVCNIVINSLQDAYKLVSQISSIFRGMGFWNGSGVGFTHDAPRDPSMIFNQANVIDGQFSYVGSSRKNRHSVALITWNDPNENFKQKIEYVEDAELIEKFGIRKTDMIAFGCTSRAQAHRLGRWILYTEKYESQLITFKVGIDSALVLPGETVYIHDDHRSGKRMGGRAKAATTTSLTLDAEISISAASGVLALVRLPDGTFAERPVKEGIGKHSVLTWNDPLPEVPLANAIYIVAEPSLVPMVARVVAVSQGDKPGTFAITALEHNPSKYDAIEKGYALEAPPTSIIDTKAANAPTDLQVVEETYEIYPGALTTRLAVSWTGDMPSYEVSYRNVTENTGWKTFVTLYSSEEITGIRNGTYEIAVKGINAFGVRSTKKLEGSHEVVGKIYAPGDVVNFKVSKRVADLMLTWDDVHDIDLAGYEVRCGASWDSGQVITTRFKGTSMVHDQSEAGSYTYFVRSIDASGKYSENPATFVLDLAAPTPVEQFNVVQSGNRLDFQWRPNPESDIAGYEIREGLSWALSVKIGEVTATNFSFPAGAAGSRYFWIVAIASPGIYGKTPMMTTYNVAQPSDRNVIFEDDEASTNFPARKIEAYATSNELVMSPGATRSEYIFDIVLPTTYRAQNLLRHGAEAILTDATTWTAADFIWDSAEANRSWEVQGNATAIAVRYQMAPKLASGMLPGELDGWTLDGALTSVNGTATVVESKNPNYAQGRYKQGCHVTDVTRLSWDVAIPALFSKTFWITPKKLTDATFITMTNGANYLRLRLSLREGGFNLIGSDGKTVFIPWTPVLDKPICVGICQTATKRRLLIGSIEIESAVAQEIDAAPISTFTKLALY